MKKIADIPKDDRPREKLQRKGPAALSDIELLAILLGKGTKEHDVLSLAEKILNAMDTNGGSPNLESLGKIKGIGPAKATSIAAALEFARRRIRPEGLRISFPPDVLPLIRHYADRKQEHLLCISLNGAREVIATRVVTVGLANRTQMHPREVFADPLIDRAAAVILAHNHPAGGVLPSKEDYEITKRVKEAGQILGIQLFDHLIFNLKDYYSFLEHNEM